MAKITYANKVALNENPEIALINKVTDDDLNEIKSVVNTNDDNVGNLTNLTTTTKTNIVAAVNEINSNAASATDLGDISGLTTTDKTSAVNAINELNSDKAEDDIILVQSTEPTSDTNILWINDGQIGTPASEITNSYSTSTGIGYSANYVNNLVQDIYALDEEVKTNKVYKNGNTIKPIYRKVVSYGALPANQASSPTVNHNIANIDMITYWYGYCINSSGVSYNFDHYPADNMVSNMSITSRVTKEWVQVKVNSDMTSYNGYFVLEYTKTTD